VLWRAGPAKREKRGRDVEGPKGFDPKDHCARKGEPRVEFGYGL